MKNATGRNITSCSSKTKKAFFGLWKQWKSAKVKCPRCRDLLSLGEQNEPTPNMLWMEEVKDKLGKNVNLVSEFAITDKNMKEEIAKRENWTATGIDGIQNFWWKKFELAQKALRKAYTDM